MTDLKIQYSEGWSPVVSPSWEQFCNFYEFVKSIDHIGFEHGLVKIVPPPGWSPRHKGCHHHEKVLDFSESSKRQNPIDVGPESIGTRVRVRTIDPPGSWVHGVIEDLDPSLQRAFVKLDGTDEAQWMGCGETVIEYEDAEQRSGKGHADDAAPQMRVTRSRASSKSSSTRKTSPTIGEYQTKLEDYVQFCKQPHSALVWLTVASPKRARKLLVPEKFRFPPSRTSNSGYAKVFIDLGLFPRASKGSGSVSEQQLHDWTFDPEKTNFVNLQTALKRVCKRSKVDLSIAIKERSGSASPSKCGGKSRRKDREVVELQRLQEDYVKDSLSVPECHYITTPEYVHDTKYELGDVGGTIEAVDDVLIQAPITQHVFGDRIETGLHSIMNIIDKEFMTVKAFREENDESEKIELTRKSRAGCPMKLIYENVDKHYVNIERDFWRNINMCHPVYGADSPGTLFHEDNCWNMNNLQTLLDVLGPYLPGVTTPYLYFGRWRAMFSLHVEDQNLYSINYLHFGAPKCWYGVPPSNYKKMEDMCKNLYAVQYRECKNFLRHKMTMVSPARMKKWNVKYCRAIQHANEFMITWPTSFHSGFNCGFNCAESVNFALPSWIPYGRKAVPCRCNDNKGVVDITMDVFDEKSPTGLASDYKVQLRHMFPYIKSHKSLRGEPEEEMSEEDEMNVVIGEVLKDVSSNSKSVVDGTEIRKTKKKSSRKGSHQKHGRKKSASSSKYRSSLVLKEKGPDGSTTYNCACGVKTPNFKKMKGHRSKCVVWHEHIQSVKPKQESSPAKRRSASKKSTPSSLKRKSSSSSSRKSSKKSRTERYDGDGGVSNSSSVKKMKRKKKGKHTKMKLESNTRLDQPPPVFYDSDTSSNHGEHKKRKKKRQRSPSPGKTFVCLESPQKKTKIRKVPPKRKNIAVGKVGDRTVYEGRVLTRAKVETWNARRVGKWLLCLSPQFSECSEAFVDNDVDGSCLLNDIDDETIQELVENKFQQNEILGYIQSIKLN